MVNTQRKQQIEKHEVLSGAIRKQESRKTHGKTVPRSRQQKNNPNVSRDDELAAIRALFKKCMQQFVDEVRVQFGKCGITPERTNYHHLSKVWVPCLKTKNVNYNFDELLKVLPELSL
jgi:predicted metal-dependent hydrolase